MCFSGIALLCISVFNSEELFGLKLGMALRLELGFAVHQSAQYHGGSVSMQLHRWHPTGEDGRVKEEEVRPKLLT